MKGCVDEYSECSVDEIAEKYIEGTPEVGTVGVHVDDTNRLPRTPEVITGRYSKSRSMEKSEKCILYGFVQNRPMNFKIHSQGIRFARNS